MSDNEKTVIAIIFGIPAIAWIIYELSLVWARGL